MALALPIVSLSAATSTPPSRALLPYRPMTAKKPDNKQLINAKFVVDWNSPSTMTLASSLKPSKPVQESLQDAFCRFRQDRMDEMRLQQRLEDSTTKKKKKIRRSDPERMRRLRLKFVEQAKRYIGIPYARKYFQEGTPEYESKMYLDCCGLVRRVMFDLSKEFGFLIGPWNQSYMYDTLPKTITNLSDVQPGDLVFISATYYNSKMKKQRHNLTHVEIMLGDGEKTLGARWNNGKVQFFDSYKFESKSYHSQIYTIKSLDPWLRGICESYCPEHSWRRRRAPKINKKSVFYSDRNADVQLPRRRRRRHSKKGDKTTTTSSSSSSSMNSSGTKHAVHRRRRRHTRSKSHHNRQRSTSAKLSSEKSNNNTPTPLLSIDTESISEDEDPIDGLTSRLSQINCLDDDQCDDSDSMDEALTAEHNEDDEIVEPVILPNILVDTL